MATVERGTGQHRRTQNSQQMPLLEQMYLNQLECPGKGLTEVLAGGKLKLTQCLGTPVRGILVGSSQQSGKRSKLR